MACLVKHLEAVGAFAEQIKRTRAFEDVMKAQKVHFEQLLCSATLSVTDASNVAAALQKIEWPQGYLGELLQVVAKKTLEGGATAVARCKLQDYRSLVHYFTSKLWDILGDNRAGSHSKLEVILQHASALGLRNPTEGSVQTLTGLLLVASEGLAGASALTAASKYQTLQHIKKVMKKHVALPCAAWVAELPREPATFKMSFPSLHEEVFSAAAPVPFPYDALQFEAVCQGIPMRSSSKLLAPVPSPNMAQLGSAVGMPAMMQQLLQFTQGHVSQQSSVGRELPGRDLSIRFLGRAQKALPDGAVHESAGEAEANDAEATDEEQDVPTEVPSKEEVEAKLPTVAAKGKRKMSVEESTNLILQQITKRDAAKAEATQGAKAKGKAKAKAKGKAKAKAKAAMPATPGQSQPKLGCGKCRGSPAGCGNCKNPNFKGKRWQR